MLSLADELAVRLDGKVPAEYMGVIQNELAVLLSYYEVKQISKEIAVYEGYLPQHFKAFFVTKKIEGASEKTLNLYMLRLKDFFKAVNKPFEEITANDVRIYLYMYQKEHHISNRTLDSIRSALCSFFRGRPAKDTARKILCLQSVRSSMNGSAAKPLRTTNLRNFERRAIRPEKRRCWSSFTAPAAAWMNL